MHQRGTTILLLLIIGIGLLLRLRSINQPFIDSISWRQASVAMIADNFPKNGWNIFYPEVSWSGPGPSYQGREFQTISYIAALGALIFGHHDWIGRVVAVLFGTWGLFALYQLVRRIWDEPHALAAVAIMAVFPGSIFYDRSFIPDPAMVALMVTAFWLIVIYAQTDRIRFLILALIIGAWGTLTKITGLILLLPIGYTVISLLHSRAVLNRQRMILLLSAAIISLIPVLAYYLWAAYLAATYPPFHFAGDGHWLWNRGLTAWLEAGYFLGKLPHLLNTWLWTWLGVILAGLGFLMVRPGKPGSAPIVPWLLHLWLAAGVIFYLIGAEELIGQPWNFHLISPAIAILAGHGLLQLSSICRRGIQRILMRNIPDSIPTIISIIMLIGLALVGQNQIQWLYYPYAEAGYEMGIALKSLTKTNDLVITIADDIGDPVAIYYSERRGWAFPPYGGELSVEELPPDDATAIRTFDALQAQGGHWFGIVRKHHEQIQHNLPGFAQHLATICQVAKQSDTWLVLACPLRR